MFTMLRETPSPPFLAVARSAPFITPLPIGLDSVTERASADQRLGKS